MVNVSLISYWVLHKTEVDVPCFFYLVAVVFDQLKDKSSIHEGKQVIEEERQTDVDFLCLLYLLKKTQQIQ